MTTVHTGMKHPVMCNGAPSKIAYARWAPSSADTQTLTDAQGITSISRTSIGLYVVNFANKPAIIIPESVCFIDNGTTLWVDAHVVSTDAAAGTATVTLKTVAFASVASGPSASDTIDELCVKFLLVGGNL